MLPIFASPRRPTRRNFTVKHMERVPDFNALPAYVGRADGAELIRTYYFPISPRSLERWPVATRHVNGRVVISTHDLLGEAKRRFDEAPVIKFGGAASSRNDGVAE